MTTLLIVLPLAAALVIWVLPLNDVSAGALALLAALAEVGVWIQLVARYDFAQGGLQFAQQRTGSATCTSRTTSASTGSQCG